VKLTVYIIEITKITRSIQVSAEMVRFFNPGGHNWGAENLDGYGICQIVVAVIYSLGFYGLCAYIWLLRNHPAIKMRKIPLALLSVLILHVYLFMVFMVYPMNGAFPCSVEFWIMSMYVPDRDPLDRQD